MCVKYISLDPQHSLISLLLPEGILEYFDLTEIGNSEGIVLIRLEEKADHPSGYRSSQLHSKGFLAEVRIHDFPIRGKKVLLCVKRRRWEDISTGEVVQRDWDLVRKGTRMTTEFALFLKGIFG